MVRRAMLAICSALLLIGMGGCGQTYELQSISVAPTSVTLEGIGSTQQLTVTAHYSNTKSAVVTVNSTFQMGPSADEQAPLTSGGSPTITVNKSGLITVLGGVCTWTSTANPAGSTKPFNYTTQPYTLTVTFQGFTAQTFVSVDSVGGCYDGISYLD